MSGIYHVYMKYVRVTDTLRADYGRHILTFESRYAADELFRALKGLKNTAGVYRFTQLSRTTPQFWCYDTALGTGDPWWAIIEIQRANTLPEFNFKFHSTILADAAAGRDLPLITNPVFGPDWVNGNTFFIRNKRQPQLYWYHNPGNDHVHISTNYRTKFRIRAVDFAADDRQVLIRSDKVTIETVGDGVSASSVTGLYVTVWAVDNPGLRVAAQGTGLGTKSEWLFGDLFGNFGVTWETSGEQLATYNTAGAGDEWELV